MPYSREIDLLKEAFLSGEAKPSIKDNQHIHAITKYKISCRYLIEKRKAGYMLFNVTDRLVAMLDDYEAMASFISVKRKKLVLFKKYEESPTKYGLYNVIDNCEYILDEETYESLRSCKPNVFKMVAIKQELEQYFNTGITQDFQIIRGINILPTKNFMSSEDLKRGRTRKPLVHDVITPEELGKKRKEESQKIKEAGIKSQTKNALNMLNNPPHEIPEYEPEYIDNYDEFLNNGSADKKITSANIVHNDPGMRLMKQKELVKIESMTMPGRRIIDVTKKDKYHFIYDASMFLIKIEEMEPQSYEYVTDDEFDSDDPLYRQSLAYHGDNTNEDSLLKVQVCLVTDEEVPLFEVYHCEGLIQYGPAHFYVQSRGTQFSINNYASEYIYYLDCPPLELSEEFKGRNLSGITSEEIRDYYLKQNKKANRKYHRTMPGCLFDLRLNFPSSAHPYMKIPDMIVNNQYMIINGHGLYDMINYKYLDYRRTYCYLAVNDGVFDGDQPIDGTIDEVAEKILSDIFNEHKVTSDILIKTLKNKPN